MSSTETRRRQLDSLLLAAVVEELNWAPEVNSTRIAVAVRDGAVFLSGQVSTYPERNLAERTVLRIHGVNAVAEELTVDSPWPASTDLDIAKEAVEALRRETDVPADTVAVVVHQHVLTLSGSVRWSFQRLAADRAVRYLRGVLDVVNLVEVHPTVTAASIVTTICTALDHTDVEAEQVTAQVNDGAVTLEGTVDSWPQRRQADEAAWSVPGVTSVANRLRVPF